MPTVTATAARSTPPLDLNIPRTDAPQRQRCHDRDEGERCEAPAPRRNPLVAAMMQALGSLMPSSKTTAAQDTKTAATDSSATAAAATPDASSSLKDAAMAFAHELFNALRSTGSGRDGGDSASESGRVHGHGRGYGDLAQRLERLASEVAAPAKPAEPAQPDSAALSITASLTTAAFSTTSDSADGSSTTSVSLTTVNLSLTQQTAPADAAKESPLLSAFRKLFDALQPASAGDAAKPDAASGLASFLRQLAQSLRGGQDAAATALPTQGSLISVSA
jgi:hypothetical protein